MNSVVSLRSQSDRDDKLLGAFMGLALGDAWLDGVTNFSTSVACRLAFQIFESQNFDIIKSRKPDVIIELYQNKSNTSLARYAPIFIYSIVNQRSVEADAFEQSQTTHGRLASLACIQLAYSMEIALANHKHSSISVASQSYNIHEMLDDELRLSDNCVDSLIVAHWIAWNSSSFLEAMQKTAELNCFNRGIWAIVGQLSGALYGFNALPLKRLDKLHNKKHCMEAAQSLIGMLITPNNDEG